MLAGGEVAGRSARGPFRGLGERTRPCLRRAAGRFAVTARQLGGDGGMFGLNRNTFEGSHRSLSCWRRRYVAGGYAALTMSSVASPVKFTYVRPAP